MTSVYYYKRISFNIIPRQLKENVDYLINLKCHGKRNVAVLSGLHTCSLCAFPHLVVSVRGGSRALPCGLRLVLLTCSCLQKCPIILPLVVPSSTVLRRQTPKTLRSKHSQEKCVVLAFFVYYPGCCMFL